MKTMELNILFSHSVTTQNGVIESVICAEFEDHLYTVVKYDEHNVVSKNHPIKYRYQAEGYCANSGKDIDIVEALKAAIGLPNTCTDVDPYFYFDHD